MINEPTRITLSSRTLIDLCLINTPSHVVDAGVLSLSISDHSLIYAIRKAHYVQGVPKTVHIRSMKQFNREHYLRDLEQKNWHNVYCSEDPNVMWKIWKENLMSAIDNHAPLRSRRVKNWKSPWITKELRQKIRHRDSLKKKANLSNDPQIWQQYKQTRNRINNEIKEVKRNYFTNNLDLHKGDMKKTWN